MDDSSRVAVIDTPGGELQLLRYQYSNHLSTATLELDDAGAIISYEEYYAFGSTSFQSGRNLAEVSLKRYRYTGKERDEESGFYYHGARYYVPWLCRWMAVDPLESKYAPQSSYVYCSNNPISRVDEDGKGDHDKNGIKPTAKPAATDNTATTGQQRQINLSLERKQLIKLYGVPYIPSGLTSTTTMQTDPTIGYTPQQQQAHEQARQARLNATGDPNRAPFKYSTSGRRAMEGANAVLDKAITLSTVVDGVGVVKTFGASLLEKESIIMLNSVAAKTNSISTFIPKPDGSFYSVAFEMKLSSASYPGISRYMHFKEANVVLETAMESNSIFNELGINVPKSSSGAIIGKSPTNWAWHHDINEGVMQLVPKNQHPDIPGGFFGKLYIQAVLVDIQFGGNTKIIKYEA